ncbi:hypothetical protein ID866_8922, partial [Astraeus odoratus]
MVHAKDRYYWAQLRAALTAGNWRSEAVAHDLKGSSLGWSGLFYKFNKHCKGFRDVAEIANQTRVLSLLLNASATEGDEDMSGYEDGSDEAIRLGEGECVLAPERVQEAREAYSALQTVESSNPHPLNLALAYFAYALGQPEECLTYLAKVPSLVDAQSHIPVATTPRPDLLAPQVPASSTGPSSPLTGSFVSAVSLATTDISDGRAWAIAESIRSMSYEKLEHSDPEKAIQAYASVLPLLNIIEFEIPRALTSQSTSISFSCYRELWRWAERLMFRVITLLARMRSLEEPDGLIWTFFSHYGACSVHWPPTFRFQHRSNVAVLHLRALIMKHRVPPEQLALNTSLQTQKPPQWLNTARSVVNEYRTILAKCTHFPRAGERNVKVEDFVDLCVAVWEACGSMSDRATWVIDILWWATRLTFNSYRIFRHMSRLAYLAGDSGLAKRTLRLYVQVVSKSREAGIDGDYDTDQRWVETLVEGARMLCRLAAARSGLDGIDEVREAGELIEKAKTRLDAEDEELVARVAVAEGVWNIVSALLGGNPNERQKRISAAITRFTEAIGAYPTPAAHYHLALALALPGPSQDIDEAVSSAGAAVESVPHRIRYWHLLGLLLTAQGQWDKAKTVLEIGASIGEADPDDEVEENGEQAVPLSNGIRAKDFEMKTPVQVSEAASSAHARRASYTSESGYPSTFSGPLLDPDATSIPASATLLQPPPDHPTPSPRDAFEYALQIRLTQMALAEHVEGPEGAEAKWLSVYSWVAERKGSVPETSRESFTWFPLHLVDELVERSSFDTGSKSAATHPGSPVAAAPQAVAEEKQPGSELPGSLGLSLAPIDGVEPPPITVTPATPADPEHKFPFDGETQYQVKRVVSMSGDSSAGKKMQQILKDRVHKESPPPPPPTLLPVQEAKAKPQVTREDRLLSDLWAASAATFRRRGKVEQAKGAIQEAEVKNPDNPAVWVQFGLYHYALNHERQAIEAFQKALFIAPDDVSASVHLTRIYLDLDNSSGDVDQDKVDLSAGLLQYITRSGGWDVPEAWYYLAKAYALQSRKDEEYECLMTALKL